MSSLTPDQIAQKWATNLGAATQTIQAGINAVQTSPGQAAARQSQVWLANTQAAQAKWQRNVGNVSLQEWKDATLNKGVPRIATGAQSAQPKMQSFMSKLLPFQESLRASLPARGDTEVNIQRAVAFMRGMTKFSNS